MDQLMEEILSPENLRQALKKVKSNKGASGVDGIGVEEIDAYLKENWQRIKEQIQKRKYKPQPVSKSRDTKGKRRHKETRYSNGDRPSHRTSYSAGHNPNSGTLSK